MGARTIDFWAGIIDPSPENISCRAINRRWPSFTFVFGDFRLNLFESWRFQRGPVTSGRDPTPSDDDDDDDDGDDGDGDDDGDDEDDDDDDSDDDHDGDDDEDHEGQDKNEAEDQDKDKGDDDVDDDDVGSCITNTLMLIIVPADSRIKT